MTIADTDRRREYTWSDPAELAAAATGVDGLTFLRWLADGTLPPPPILHTLGGTLVAVAHGEATFELDAQEYHYNPIGSVHGGVYATLLDSACGCAVQSTLAAGTAYTSLDLTVKFVRGITVDTGTVTCTGRVIHAGRRTALARAEIVDAGGRLLGEASSSCLILGGR